MTLADDVLALQAATVTLQAQVATLDAALADTSAALATANSLLAVNVAAVSTLSGESLSLAAAITVGAAGTSSAYFMAHKAWVMARDRR